MSDDHIYLFSPSGAYAPELLERSVSKLKALGYKVTVDKTAAKRHMRFAGTDADRLASMQRAANSKCGVLMITRGGYGMSRLLPQLDCKALLACNKKWIGYSDFTAFHMAALSQTTAKQVQGKLYAGPSASFFAGQIPQEVDHHDSSSTLDETTVGTFADMLSGSAEALGWEVKSPKSYATQGRLWGGNLCMMASLVGTPYMPKINNGIFFCEDVGEVPYRIERMFAQLLQAGILQRQKAVLLGHFTEYKLAPNDAGYDLPVVVDWLRAQLKPYGVPVITGLPFGHTNTKLTLPIGAKVELMVQRDVTYLVFAH
jgi:muramoyltetrapeptide carboxypeptidase